ncbi:VOC family protein [Enterococcus sp. LJL120]
MNGLAHVGINVHEMKKSLNFYCDTLGLTHKFSIEDHDGNPWIEYLELGDKQFIELFYHPDAVGKSPDLWKLNRIHHVALSVEDIFGLYSSLLDTEVNIKEAPKLGPDFTWQMWLKDPDGNEIEIMQYTEDSYQLQP